MEDEGDNWVHLQPSGINTDDKMDDKMDDERNLCI